MLDLNKRTREQNCFLLLSLLSFPISLPFHRENTKLGHVVKVLHQTLNCCSAGKLSYIQYFDQAAI